MHSQGRAETCDRSRFYANISGSTELQRGRGEDTSALSCPAQPAPLTAKTEINVRR